MNQAIRIMIVSKRPIDSTGPWPRQEEIVHTLCQYEQAEFYADGDDTSVTSIFEVNNDYDLYYLVLFMMQFETTTKIEVTLPDEN